MLKTYIVRLSQEERQTLQDLVSTGIAAAYKIKHANILLNIDVNGQGWTDEKAAAAFSCHRNTVANIRERLVNEGLESALNRKPSKMPPCQRVIDGEVEAKLIALRCGEAPAGQARWTVCDQLNTHKLASLYQAFEPSTARSLVERLEIHHTPKHGSWLNIAENELSAMTRQCLDRRIPDIETLEQETTAWYIQRNHSQKSVDWQFTTGATRFCEVGEKTSDSYGALRYR